MLKSVYEGSFQGIEIIYFLVQFQGLSKIKMLVLLCLYGAFYNIFVQQLKMKAKLYFLCSSEKLM